MKSPLDTTFDGRDPYKTLGVSADATPVAIQKAYLALVRRSHPDLFATDPDKYRSATIQMQDINAAYDLLSDPTRRELWNRRHSVAPRPTPRHTPGPSDRYQSPLASRVIRRYNTFVDSLRTAAERKAATRKIEQFQASRAGSAYIRELVARLYGDVMDLIKLGRRITMYDDGLVEIMFLYPGALEVVPSTVFITYAYLVHRENRGRFPAGLDAKRSPEPNGAAPAGSGPNKGLGPRVWEWLMAKPSPRRRGAAS